MKKIIKSSVFLSVLVLCSCGRTEVDQNMEQKETTLSLGIMNDYVPFIQTAITEYKKRYPDIEIELVTYTNEERETDGEKRRAELMAGKGQDLYVYIETEGFDFYKVQKSNVFLNMLPLFEADEEFSRDDFVDGTFDIFNNEGNCFILPTETNVSATVTSKDVNEKLPIKLEQVANYSQYIQNSMEYINLFPNRLDVSLSEGFGEYSSEWNVGIQDGTDALEILFNSQTWKDSQVLTKRRVDMAGKDLRDIRLAAQGYEESIESFIDKKNFMCMNLTLDQALEVYCRLGGENEAIITQIPNCEGNIGVGFGRCVAINRNSKNQGNAFNFIKIMLEEEYQTESLYSTPIIKKYITGEEWKEKYGEDVVLIDGEVFPGVPEKKIDEIVSKHRMGSLAKGLYSDSKEKYLECMSQYHQGKKELNECVEEFCRYIKVYDSE